MKKVIVTTTINPPTKAILGFQAMKDWELVVIGDKKTPPYKLERGIYVGPEEQEKYDPALSEAIGWNCIQRRNLGLLWAHDMGADIVAVVDDDNIPYPGSGEALTLGREVSGARATRASSRSATWLAAPCWRIKRHMKANWPSRC